MMNRFTVALCALGVFSFPSAFSLVAPRPSLVRKQATSALQISIAADIEDETNYRGLLNKAREYAFSSENASPRQAKKFLNDILQIQSGCATGVVAGHDLCDNVDEVAEIVSHLREKAVAEPQAADPAKDVATLLQATLLVMMVAVFASTVDRGQEVAPFQLQEWWWAAKDGYLSTMISHYIRNGGL